MTLGFPVRLSVSYVSKANLPEVESSDLYSGDE